MSKTKTSAEVPNLRFPGFEGEWKRSALEDHISLLSGYAFQSEFFGEEGQRLITPKNFTKFGRASFTPDNTKKTTEEVAERFQCKAGDLVVLLTDLTPTCELLGKPALLGNEDAPCLLNQRIAKVIFETRDLDSTFLSNLMLSEAYVRRIKDTATGTTVRHSSNKIVLSFEASFPTLPEQQKIAAFLTVVDGRIEQLSRKKALLEEYKKGVMQQLFTQTLRFQDDHGHDFPDWEEKTLKSICSTFKSGNGITAEEIQDSGAYPVYGGNGLRGYTDRFTHEGEFVLIGRQGALCGNINRASGKSYISEHAIAVAGNHLASTDWLEHRLDHMKLNRLSESSAQPGLAVNKLEKLKLLVPSLPEQTKIAGFLSAMDGKIAAVGEQMRQTQAWKKGLLQQMFV